MLVFFDLDGTLSDPGAGIAASLGHALRSLGHPPPSAEAVAASIGPPLPRVFDGLLPDADADTRARALDLYRQHYRARGWSQNRVYPGVPDLLASVAGRGWRACIATSKTRPSAERIVRHFGLHRFLARVYGRESDGRLAEKSELLAHALACEAAEPARCVMVGDRRFDVEAARAVGLHPIGVGWGYGSRDELRSAGAEQVCESPAALLAALDAFARAAGEP